MLNYAFIIGKSSLRNRYSHHDIVNSSLKNADIVGQMVALEDKPVAAGYRRLLWRSNFLSVMRYVCGMENGVQAVPGIYILHRP